MNEVKRVITPIAAEHDERIGDIIRVVGAEFGAIGEGFGPADDEVKCMSQHYKPDRGSLYLVGLIDARIVGGCGIAPFGNMAGTCELKKLFLLPEGRGFGLGMSLTQACLEFARQWGYQQCYLDTLSNMTAALALYEKLGFRRLSAPLEGTVHNGCDVWMLKELRPEHLTDSAQ